MKYGHVYWHSRGVTDLDVMRKDAHLRLKGYYTRGVPESSIIHHHPYGLDCDIYKHEEFLVEEEAKDGQTTSE